MSNLKEQVIELRKYTVIGVRRWDFSRFACHTEADDPQMAEFNTVEFFNDDIVIAGVFTGWHDRVDIDSNDGRPDERYCYRCGKQAGNLPNPHHSPDCSLFDDH